MKSRKAIALVLIVLMVLMNFGPGSSLVFADDPQPLSVDWYTPLGITTETLNFEINLGGAGADKVTSVGVYKDGIGESLVDVLSTKPHMPDQYGAAFKLKDEVVLNAADSYVIRITDGTTTIDKPLNVADLVYYLDYDTIGGQSKFLMSLVIDGSEANQAMFEDHAIQYYDNPNFTGSPVGSGKVVKHEDKLYVTASLVDGFTLGGAQAMYYQFVPFAGNPDFSMKYTPQINGYEAVMPFEQVTVLPRSWTDYPSYEIEVGVYGISQDLTKGCDLLQILDANNQTVVQDIKVNPEQETGVTVQTKTITVDSVEFPYQSMIISVDKLNGGLVPGNAYNIFYRSHEGLVWMPSFSLDAPEALTKVNNYYPMAEYEAAQGDSQHFEFNGAQMDQVASIGLFEVGDNTNFNCINPSNITSDSGRYSFDCNYTKALNVSNSYEFRITPKSGLAPNPLPLYVAKETYDFSPESIQVGQRDFAVKLHIKSNGPSALLGKEIKFYNDVNHGVEIGTGKFIDLFGRITMIVNMIDPVDADTGIFYEINGIDPNEIMHRSGPDSSKMTIYTPSTAGPEMYKTDWDLFESTSNDPNSDTVDLKFYTIGISDDISNIFLKDTTTDPQTLKNLGDIGASVNTGQMTLTDLPRPIALNTITLTVPKSAFILDHEYEVVFKQANNSDLSYGSFSLKGLELHWLNPRGLWSNTNEFFLNMGGIKINTVTDVGLYEKTTSDNLIEEVPGTFEKRFDYYQNQFKLKGSTHLVPSKSYEFRISDGNKVIKRDVKVGDLIYELGYDHVGGKDQVLISLKLQGSAADKAYFLEHGVINYYSDDTFNTLIGSGKVIQLDSGSDLYYATVNFVDGYDVNQFSDYFFKFEPFAGKAFESKFDAHMSRNPAILLREVEVSTQSDTTYDLTLLTYGVTADLNTGCDVLKLTGDNGFELDIKKELQSNTGKVSVEVESKTIGVDMKPFTYDLLTIKLNKQTSGLVLGNNYHLQYDAKPNWGWGMDFQLGTAPIVYGIDGNYPTAKELRPTDDGGFYILNGRLLNGIKSFGLYEKSGTTNLLKDVVITEERDDKHFYEFKFNTALDKAKSYEIRVVGPDDTIQKFDYDVVAETYEADSPLQIGKKEFYVQTSLGLYNRSPLLGKTLNFYADNDSTTAPVGTGEFVLDSGMTFIKVSLNDNVVPNQRLYYKILNIDGMDIKHRGYTEGNLASIAANASNNPILFGPDFSFFNASQEDLNDTDFDFMILAENTAVTSNTLDQFSDIKLHDILGDTEVSILGMPGMTITKESSDSATYDKVLIQVPKTSFVKGHSYDIRFYDQDGNFAWSFGTFDISALKVDYYAKAIEKWQINGENWIYIAGTLFSEIKDWGIFNKSDNRKISVVNEITQNTQNVIEARYHFTETYDSSKQYELRVIDQNDEVLNNPIHVADIVFNYDERSVKVGQKDFNIYMYGSNESPLIGQTINFYMDKAQSVPNGTGLFKVIGGMPFIEVHLANETQLGDKLYYKIQGLGGSTVAHSDYLDQSEAHFANGYGALPTVTGEDRVVYDNTLGDVSKTYVDYKFYGLNMNASSTVFDKIELVDKDVPSLTKTVGDIAGASIIMGTAFGGQLETVTIRIPKNALTLNHVYQMKFTDLGRAWIMGDYVFSGLTIDWFHPSALTVDEARYFNIDFGGSLINTVTSVGLYQKGTDVNLVDLVPEMGKKESNYYSWDYKLKAGVVLLPANTYEFRVSNGVDTITRAVDIAALTYFLGWDTIAGRSNFLLSLEINGPKEDIQSFVGHSIEYYNNPDLTGPSIGSGRVVFYEGRYYATVDLNPGVVLKNNDRFYEKFAPFPDGKDYAVKFDKQGIVAHPAVLGDKINPDPFVASVEGNGSTYDIEIWQYGITADLATGCKRLEIRDGITKAIVLDVKALLAAKDPRITVGTGSRNISDDGKIYPYETLKIQVDKATGGLAFGDGYYVEYESNEGLVWQPWFNLLEIQDYSSVALDKLDVNPIITLKVLGLQLIGWIEIELYEKGTENDLTKNLLKEIDFVKPTVFDQTGKTGTMYCSFELADGKSIDPTKEYSLRFMFNDYSLWRDFKFEETYKPDFNGDGKVTPRDLAMMVLKHNLKKDQEGYDPLMDMNEDGVIDLLDYRIVSKMMFK